MDTNSETENAPPQPQSLSWRRALTWHSIGFATLVILLWADELFIFAYNYFFGDWRQVEVGEAAIRSGVVIVLWIYSAFKIHQVLSRLKYVESLMHFCSWCSRVEQDGQWPTIQEHFTKETGKQPSHGMCPDRAAKFKNDFLNTKPSVDGDPDKDGKA